MLSYCVVRIILKISPMILFNDWLLLVHLLKTGSITLTFICGLLPRDECLSINRVIIDKINDLLSFTCSVNNFHFIDQSNRWTLSNGKLDFSLFYSDGLHLVEKGNLQLGKSILKAIDSIIIGSKIPSCYKMQCAPQISIWI